MFFIFFCIYEKVYRHVLNIKLPFLILKKRFCLQIKGLLFSPYFYIFYEVFERCIQKSKQPERLDRKAIYLNFLDRPECIPVAVNLFIVCVILITTQRRHQGLQCWSILCPSLDLYSCSVVFLYFFLQIYCSSSGLFQSSSIAGLCPSHCCYDLDRGTHVGCILHMYHIHCHLL